MQFIHLHNHTHYSLLDGLTKIDEFVQAAKEDGQEALAITDHGVMYGVVEFFQKCKQAGIKPIIGVEAYLAPNSRFDKILRSDEKNYHLLLLAKNNKGYKNLIKLTTIAHLEGFYYKPRIDWEILQKYHNGLIACTACLSGEIPKLIQKVQEYFADGTTKAKRQDHSQVTYFGIDRRHDRQILWKLSGVKDILNLIRTELAFCVFRGKKIILLNSEVCTDARSIEDDFSDEAGTIGGITNEGMIVRGKNGLVRVKEVVFRGKRMPSSMFVKKSKIKAGEQFE